MKELSILADEVVIEQVVHQDQELYREIIARYQEKLLRYANYLVHDSQEAADIVQTSFIKAFVNLNSFKAKLKFSSWIYRIVHNEAINSLLKHKKEQPILEEMDFPAKEDMVEDLMHQEEREALKTCANKLPLIYSEPLLLFIFEEKNYEEISDILRLPLGTVGSRINRGKTLIKKICQTQQKKN
ncbi:MAG: sigma-70 family RNA polymerase sigma factor [Candidatus Falkowbacteria bacterium]|nr:sigma-70 family RNA polymerase sigma factor [Candidatus Falkowbacteria bacterium]